jgi:hypothetical protein
MEAKNGIGFGTPFTLPILGQALLVGPFCLGHVARLRPWQAQKNPQVMKGDAFDPGRVPQETEGAFW